MEHIRRVAANLIFPFLERNKNKHRALVAFLLLKPGMTQKGMRLLRCTYKDLIIKSCWTGSVNATWNAVADARSSLPLLIRSILPARQTARIIPQCVDEKTVKMHNTFALSWVVQEHIISLKQKNFSKNFSIMATHARDKFNSTIICHLCRVGDWNEPIHLD